MVSRTRLRVSSPHNKIVDFAAFIQYDGYFNPLFIFNEFSYAVIASGCASCPRIKCERPGCDVNFCYHCKAEWHPDQTCDAARASRQSPMRAASGSISQDSQHRTDDIKPCPRCQVLIVKMDDGSCNHMVCAVCGSEFCWLCMKEISDLHYLR